MVSATFDLVIEEIQDICEFVKIDTEILQMIDESRITSYKSRMKCRILQENVKIIAKNSKLMMSHIYVHLITIHIPGLFYLLYERSLVLLNKWLKKSGTQKLQELES